MLTIDVLRLIAEQLEPLYLIRWYQCSFDSRTKSLLSIHSPLELFLALARPHCSTTQLLWGQIGASPHITPGVVKKHLLWHHGVFYTLSTNSVLNQLDKWEKVIIRYRGNWDWKALNRQPLMMQLYVHPVLKKYLLWEYFSSNPCLTEELIIQYESKWHWRKLSSNPCLTEKLIIQYEGGWYWSCLSANRALTLDLVERYHDKVFWSHVGSNPNLTLEFIKKHWDKWDSIFWGRLSGNSALNEPIINYCQRRWLQNSILDQIDPSHLDIHLDSDQCHSKWCWAKLSQNHHLTSAILEQYLEQWSRSSTCSEWWSNLSSHPALTSELIYRYHNLWDWKKLSSNPAIMNSITLIPKYRNKWSWVDLTYLVLHHRWELLIDHPEWPWEFNRINRQMHYTPE